MNDNSENKDLLEKSEKRVLKSNSSNISFSGNDESSSGPSTSQAHAIKSSNRKTGKAIVAKINDVHTDGVLQVKTKIRNEKKKNVIKLSTESSAEASIYESEIVGDDLNKKKELHILCECEPTVAGAAVPTVISFVKASLENVSIDSTAIPKIDMDKNNRQPSLDLKNTVNIQNIAHVKVDEKANVDKNKNKRISKATNEETEVLRKEVKGSQEPIEPLKKAVKITNKDDSSRKRSLIPKLAATFLNGTKWRENPNQKASKLISQNNEHKLSPDNKMKDTTKADFNKNIQKLDIKPPKTLEENKITSSNISSKVLGLQERLKATTSLLRQKIELNKSKEQSSSESSSKSVLLEKADSIECKRSKVTLEDLYINTTKLKNIVTTLSESGIFTSQQKYIEKLFGNISEIKNITNKLYEMENDREKAQQGFKCELENDLNTAEKEDVLKKLPTCPKDNKIHIKFLATKERRNEINNKVRMGRSPEISEAVQTNLSLDPKLTSGSLTSDVSLLSKVTLSHRYID